MIQPAFTLVEVLLVLLLSSILIVSVYAVITFAGRQWSSFHKIQSRLNGMVLFRQAFASDVDRSSCMYTGNPQWLSLIRETDTIHYFFDTVIVRHAGVVHDTFPFHIRHPEFGLVPGLEEDGIVSSVSMDIISPVMLEQVVFRKHYTAYELMHASGRLDEPEKESTQEVNY